MSEFRYSYDNFDEPQPISNRPGTIWGVVISCMVCHLRCEAIFTSAVFFFAMLSIGSKSHHLKFIDPIVDMRLSSVIC
ncbi:hypothetical protein M426DRAFT_324985 [Hypoxylon sp. CI-4A]|nr:hypothetical protein M426DRAFT_324985 [Hypoxylon sp. CI-4A]